MGDPIENMGSDGVIARKRKVGILENDSRDIERKRKKSIQEIDQKIYQKIDRKSSQNDSKLAPKRDWHPLFFGAQKGPHFPPSVFQRKGPEK